MLNQRKVWCITMQKINALIQAKKEEAINEVLKKVFPHASKVSHNNIFINDSEEIAYTATNLRGRVRSMGIDAELSRFFFGRELKFAVVTYADRIIVVGNYNSIRFEEIYSLLASCC